MIPPALCVPSNDASALRRHCASAHTDAEEGVVGGGDNILPRDIDLGEQKREDRQKRPEFLPNTRPQLLRGLAHRPHILIRSAEK
eukprot:2374534-Pyramimonas_sp.AAC.1